MRSHLTKLMRVVSRLATVDQTEVCPLSREVMSQPLSGPLQPDIRFFRPPIPAQSSASLAVRLPAKQRLATIQAYHVPGMSHDRRRFRLSPGGLTTT
ncbi:hypothetical protein DF050_19240 [Burkholderia cepacia]|nr:hypothetical protein DF050_19240 [Burkholderia cepacia]